MESKIIITGITLSDKSREDISGFLGKLLRHHRDIIHVRLDLHEGGEHHGVAYHVAKTVIEIPGRDFVASTSSDDLYKSIHMLVNKADRYLSERSRHAGTKRRRPHAIDLAAPFPKAVFS